MSAGQPPWWLGVRTTELEAEVRRRRNAVDQDQDRGTRCHPCEECCQDTEGSTMGGLGRRRCNVCGYPSEPRPAS